MVQFVNIIKSVNNKRFVRKDEELYFQLTYSAKRVWLSEEMNIKPDKNIIYEISFSSGEVFEGIIYQKGIDENGFYIVLALSSIVFRIRSRDKLTNKIIPKGKTIFREVFNPYEIPGAIEMMENYDCNFPLLTGGSFNVEKIENNIHIELKGLCEIGIKLELNSVYKEKYIGDKCDSLDYFIKNHLKMLFIRKNDANNYLVYFNSICIYEKIYNNSKRKQITANILIEKNDNSALISCKSIKIQHYNVFEKELERNNIKYKRLNKDRIDDNPSNYFRKRWSDTFLANVDIKDINIDQFLWHVFSSERLKALEGFDANKKLNKVKKDIRYMFLNNSNLCYRLENTDLFDIRSIMSLCDVYITDENFTWTYVYPHEAGLFGPYFYSNDIL